jgi:hypothetical protein
MSGIKIQVKRGSSSQWTSIDPILAEGEIGLELDTNKIKFGKGGSYRWSQLNYFSSGSTPYISSVDTNSFSVTGGNLALTAYIPVAGTDYIAFSEKGTAGGIAELNGDGVVPDGQIGTFIARKDYVDNVVSQAQSAAESYADGIIPSQSGNATKFLQTDGTSLSWTELPTKLIGPISLSTNQPLIVDETAIDGFDLIEYTVYIRQGSLYRASKLFVLSDGTDVSSDEYAISELGGYMDGVMVTASVDGGIRVILQVQILDADTNNASIKLIKDVV